MFMLKTQSEKQSLASLAKRVSQEFRKIGVTYDQSRYVFKLARLSVGLKAQRTGEVKPRGLSEAQVDRLFTVISNPTDLLMFRLIYGCALRVSGLRDLKRADVSLDEFKITVRFNKTNGGVIPFPRSLKPLLLMHLHGESGGEALFQSSHRKPYSTRAIQLKFKKYAKLAGLPAETSVHSLRHSCLTHLAAKGLQSSQLQAISLHRSKASLDSYVRLSCADVREAYDDAMFGR